jgi:hypothetical protein
MAAANSAKKFCPKCGPINLVSNSIQTGCHRNSPYETVPSHRSGMLLKKALSRVSCPKAIGTNTQVATPRKRMTRVGY